MTTPVFLDRVMETTSTTGTGSYALGGAVGGYQSFAGVGNGGETYYAITDGTNWEVGLGTYSTTGPTLARTTILASSNSGSAVSWSAGSKNIWLDFPAAVAAYIAAGVTGTGAVVLADSPAIVTPDLGTPSAINLTNATGLTAALVQTALASLPTTLPGSSGQLWWNGGVLSLS